MKKIIFMTFCIAFFAGCESSETIRCELQNPIVSSNSPVMSATSIFLKTPDYDVVNGASFEWTGPNGFHSNEQNPIIPNASAAMSGDYKLKITKGICVSDEVSTTVEVITNTVTCSQKNDTCTFSGGTDPLSYTTAVAVMNNEFRIYSWNYYDDDIMLYFPGDTSPKAGIYTVVSSTTPLSDGKVHIVYSDVFNALSGDVSVSYDNDMNVIVKFCSVPFSYKNGTSKDITGSAMFTQNQ